MEHPKYHWLNVSLVNRFQKESCAANREGKDHTGALRSGFTDLLIEHLKFVFSLNAYYIVMFLLCVKPRSKDWMNVCQRLLSGQKAVVAGSVKEGVLLLL